MSKRWSLGVILFDGFTMLDMVGPITALEEVCDLYFIYKAAPVQVETDTLHLSINSTHTYEDVPSPDLIVIPGGFGVTAAIDDAALLAYLRKVASSGALLTSVCTGSIILAAAGLLKGYSATTHWMMHDALNLLGATSVQERVVQDRNRITGAGVSAGIDLGLTVLAHLTDEQMARRRQLQIEYDPKPIFSQAGNQKSAEKSDKDYVESGLQDHKRELFDAINRVAKRRTS